MTDHHTTTPEAAAAYERHHHGGWPDDTPTPAEAARDAAQNRPHPEDDCAWCVAVRR